MNNEKLLTPRNNLGVSEGRREGEGGNRVMSIEEGLCCDKQWVLYLTNESPNTASWTIIQWLTELNK